MYDPSEIGLQVVQGLRYFTLGFDTSILQVGSFESEDANYMTCGKGIHNSITHINKERKSRVTATWRAPQDFEGEVIFKYSVGSSEIDW